MIHNYFTFTAISSFLDTLGEEFRLAGAELRKAKNGGDSVSFCDWNLKKVKDLVEFCDFRTFEYL